MLCVKPGKVLVYKHKYRSEHWVVVKGEAKVTIANEIKIKVGESVYTTKSQTSFGERT